MKTSIVCLMHLAIILLPHPVDGDEFRVSFQESQTIGSLSNLSGALTDLDNDGDLDIYLSNYAGPSQVWFNDGQGFFTPGDFFGLSFTQEITCADFDGDTFQDVFLPSNGIPTSLWFNDGTGQFTMSQQSMEQTGGGEVAAGDFDADGDMDLFLGWKTPIEDSVAFNDGSGFFLFPNGRTNSSAYPLAVGDLDADGDLDAFVARGSSVTPLGDLVLFNDGHGVFQLQSPDGLGSSFGTDVELADIDNDGDLDAFVTNISFSGSSGADTIWINDGTGNFTDSGQMLGNENSYDVAIADVDSDGDIDVLVTATDAKQRLWLNDGNGVFNEPLIISEVSDASQGLLGDIDGDGDADAVIVAFPGTRVLKNNTAHVGVVGSDSFNLVRGIYVSGELSDAQESDDSYLKFNPGLTLNPLEPPVGIEFDGTLPNDSPASLSVTLEASANTPNLDQTIEAFNWLTGQYEQIDSQSASFNSDSVVTVDLTADIGKYVESGTGAVKTRTGWKQGGLVLSFPWTVCIDHVVWTITE